MPDTRRQSSGLSAEHRRKSPGLGFPIVRMVVLLSLATGLLCDMALGPYAGKETGENALLRTLWDALQPGDILLADRLYCSYCLLALALQRNVDCVVRLHQRRKTDFRRGQCIARGDRVVEWRRPERPEWMDEATYATIPATMRLRQILVEVHEPGFRAGEAGRRHDPAGRGALSRRRTSPNSTIIAGMRNSTCVRLKQLAGHGPSAVQVAGDGSQGNLDGLAGLQSDPQEPSPRRPCCMANCRGRSASPARCRRSPPRGTCLSDRSVVEACRNWPPCNSRSSPATTWATARPRGAAGGETPRQTP